MPLLFASVVVLSLAPGRGVPADFVKDARYRLEQQLGADVVRAPDRTLRDLDQRTGAWERARGEHERARRLHAQFPEDAVSALGLALQTADEGYVALYAPEVVSEMLVDLGQMELERGQPEESRRAFQHARELTPMFEPSAARSSPSAREAFNQIPAPDCAALDLSRARRAAQALGAKTAIALQTCLQGGHIRLVVYRVDETGKEEKRAALVPPSAGLETATARRLLGLPESRPAPPPAWYRRPWVWALAGAAVAAAVVVPIATADETATVTAHW